MTNFRIWSKSIQDERLKGILTSFGGDITDATKYEPGADVDVIFGSWKDRDVEHHNLKRDIVKNSKNVIVMETPLLGRQKVEEFMPDSWVRVGLNGFMRNAEYPDIKDTKRFQKILADTGEGKYLTTETQKTGEYILLVLQLPGDASLEFTDMHKWSREMVYNIRKITDRDIVVRFPQLERPFDFAWQKEEKINGVYYQHGHHKDKEPTLANAYAVVTYSSGMGVEAILRGRRTYVESENGFWSRRSSLSEVLQKNYENHEDMVSYDKWLNLITSTQWHMDEIASGDCRKAFTELLNV